MDDLKNVALDFNYSLIDTVNNILVGQKIHRKVFEQNNVKYIVSINEEQFSNIINLLMMTTSRQIKITNLDHVDVEEAEVGTDKPLGSKSAIDEN